MARNDDHVMMENVRIIFRNLTGSKSAFNPQGKREFSIVLPPDVAENMLKDGWNVKRREPKDEGDEPLYHLKVVAHYGKGNGPRVVMINSSSRRRTALDEETVGMLDYADIRNVDLIIRPYKWEFNGKTGTTAYLVSLFVTIDEDPLEAKYAAMDTEPDDEPAF